MLKKSKVNSSLRPRQTCHITGAKCTRPIDLFNDTTKIGEYGKIHHN